MKKLEIFLKNILLKILLSFNKPGASLPLPEIGPNSRVLFIRLNRIGDALVTTPLLKYISEKCKCKTDILADRKNSFIFNYTSNKHDIILYKKGLREFFKLISQINNNKYDVIVDLHDDISTTVSFILALSKSPYKFGLTKGNEQLYTHTVQRLAPDKYHVVNRILEISKLFNLVPPAETNIDFVLSEEAKNYAKDFISKHNLKRFKVGINISAGSSARFWGVERFKKITEYFSAFDADILILTAPTDIRAAEIISNEKYPVYFSEKFEKFCALISELDFLFSPDTSIIHIASAFRIPLFGIYVKYNTNDIIWYPVASKYEVAVTEEPNFENLDFNEVRDKLKPFFEYLYYEETNTAL